MCIRTAVPYDRKRNQLVRVSPQPTISWQYFWSRLLGQFNMSLLRISFPTESENDNIYIQTIGPYSSQMHSALPE
jgi:hypothetical protein